MTDLPVLRSRQANGVERRSHEGPSDALVEKAKMLAAAGSDTLPKGYANKPGACLMALDWADRNDVSIFEVIAEVAMVYGKPVVSAKMQKRLAARAGAHTKVIESTAEQATVAVLNPDGSERGRYTYTFVLADSLGLPANSKKGAGKGGTDFWAVDRAWMLVKRATTRALELYGPDELVTIFADDEETPADDQLPAVEDPPEAAEAGRPASEPAASGSSEPIKPEIVDVEPPTLNSVLDAAKAKGIKPAALKAQAIAMDYEVGAINQLMDNSDALMDLADWIDQQ